MEEKAKFHFVEDSPHIFIENPIGSYRFERYDYENGDTRWEIKRLNDFSDNKEDMKKYIAWCYTKKDEIAERNVIVNYKKISIIESDLSYIPHKEKFIYDKVVILNTEYIKYNYEFSVPCCKHVYVEKFTDIDFANIIRRELRASILMAISCPSVDAYGLPAKESEYYYELYCNPVKNKLASSIFDK